MMSYRPNPTILGAQGFAWMDSGELPGFEACIRLYYVYLDTYHPILKWFLVACNHLRDEPGLVAANKSSSDKTHEFIVAAIDPETYLFEDFDLETKVVPKIYPPLVLNYQHGGLNDTQGCHITDKLVTELVDGQQIPDEDTRQHWVDSIIVLARWSREAKSA